MNIYLTKGNTVKKKTESLIVASEMTEIAVNVRKTMYMTMYRDQNTGRSHNIMIDNKSSDRQSQIFQIFETNHN